MHRYLARFLALLALALMPVAMAGSPAAAHTNPAVEAGHCGEHGKPASEPTMPQAHCTACNALPAIESPGPVAGLLLQTPRTLARMDPISDIEPETATPPPKPS